jgi:uncharacterized protein (DUF362 family)
MSEEQLVAIVKGSEIPTSVDSALALIGGIEKIVRAGDRVLVKPNFGVPMDPSSGVVTDPRVVETVVEICANARPREIVVGESAVVGFDTGEVFRRLGLIGRFERFGARLMDLKEDEIIEVPVPKGSVLRKIRLSRIAYEADVLISIPTMKTHVLTGVSLGLKNMKGVLPDDMKKLMHRIGAKDRSGECELDHAIADLASVLPPTFTLIDGFTASEGYKPTESGIGGVPIRFDVVVAGLDPVAVDAVGAYLMGFDPREIRHIFYAEQKGIGSADLAKIEIAGTELASCRRIFERPSPNGLVMNLDQITVEGGRKGCSGCREAVVVALSGMKRSELRTLGKAILVVGPRGARTRREENVIFVGNCATCGRGRRGRIRIEGCPPPAFYIRERLMETGFRSEPLRRGFPRGYPGAAEEEE